MFDKKIMTISGNLILVWAPVSSLVRNHYDHYLIFTGHGEV